MAYTASITRRRVTVNGRKALLIDITEIEASPSSEFEISNLCQYGTIILWQSEITSGTGVDISPKIGNQAGFTEFSMNHVASSSLRSNYIDERDHLVFITRTDEYSLYIRNNVNQGTNNTIETRIIILEGHEGVG